MARKMRIELEAESGTIERFYAFVDRKKRIADDGDEKRTWTGEVGDDAVRVKLRVFGIGTARYRFKLDLPGTVDDQDLVLALCHGYHELELTI